jgi:hypothetical protein
MTTAIGDVTASGFVPGTTTNDLFSNNTASKQAHGTSAIDASSGKASATSRPQTTNANATAPSSASSSSGGASSGSGSGSGAAAAQALKQLIDRLQQLLAQVEAQITAAAARSGRGGSPDAALSSLQAEASMIQGEISAATAKLAEMLMSQGQTVGGLVNSQA